MTRNPTYEELKQRVKQLEDEAIGRKKAEGALYESEKKPMWSENLLKESQKLAHLGSFEWDIVNNVIERSDELYRIFGITHEELGPEVHLGHTKMIHPDDQKIVQEAFEISAAGHHFGPIEFRIIRPDGTERVVSSKNKIFFDTDGKPVKSVGYIFDITERKRTEEALLKSEERFRSLVELTSDWIWEVNQNGVFTYADPKVKDFLGYEPEEVVGKPYNYFMNEDSKKKLASSFKDQKEKPRSFSKRRNLQLHKDGREIVIEASGLPIFDIDGKVVGWRGLDSDITERVRIEGMMIQAEKMLSVGGLAAGMAHEINNPLAGIMQNIQVMKNRMSGELSKNIEVAEECGASIETIETYMEKRGMFEMIDLVMEAGKRAAKIVNNMLSFSRKSDESFAPHSLSDLLDKTIELAENDYDLKQKFDFRQIEIVERYDKATPQVKCEGSKIQQVILNILKNGAQAMAEGKGRTSDDRQLKTEGESEIGVSRFILRVMPDGEMARIEIEDNGPGMDEETRKRVFEPFFTTKGVGIGTGLGLSVSYFIITENHGGTMEVESAPGKGAKFIIQLPFERNV